MWVTITDTLDTSSKACKNTKNCKISWTGPTRRDSSTSVIWKILAKATFFNWSSFFLSLYLPLKFHFYSKKLQQTMACQIFQQLLSQHYSNNINNISSNNHNNKTVDFYPRRSFVLNFCRHLTFNCGVSFYFKTLLCLHPSKSFV